MRLYAIIYCLVNGENADDLIAEFELEEVKDRLRLKRRPGDDGAMLARGYSEECDSVEKQLERCNEAR
jgi:hypothetical protein